MSFRASCLALGVLLLLLTTCQTDEPARTPPLDPPALEPAGGGACAEPDVEGVAVVRFASEGQCVPGGDMVLYRCSSTAVPVLRLSSETGPVAFIGGPFAVRVTTLPANVRFAGSGDGLEVLIADPVVASSEPAPSLSASPSIGSGAGLRSEEEPLVYVRHEGVTDRWLRLVPRRVLNDPPVAWLIGDSILDGGREDVEMALDDWVLTMDAEVGRSSFEGVALAQAAVDQQADVVFVELGTNDSSVVAFRSHLIETLGILRGVPLVLWQTARGSEEERVIPDVNAAIREVAPGYPNVAIADWETFVPDEAVQLDGVHPDEGFERLESELLAPLLSEWRDAMAGTGATSCGRRVLRAAS